MEGAGGERGLVGVVIAFVTTPIPSLTSDTAERGRLRSAGSRVG